MHLHDFQDILVKAWSIEVTGNPLYQLVSKLKSVKKYLKTWLKEETILPSSRIKIIRQKLHLIHETMANNPTDVSLHNKEEQLKHDLNVCLAHEESQFRQKSRENWLKLGDKNSKFLYSSLKCRQAQNNLNHLLKSDGTPMTDIVEIKQQAPIFFENLFTQNSYWTSFPEIIVKKKLTQKASAWLIRGVNVTEIEEALHQIPSGKAPGPDGFNAAFFKHNWNLLKCD